MKQWIIPALILLFGVINMMALYWTGPKLDPKPVASLAPLVRVMTVTPEQVQMTSATHGTIAHEPKANSPGGVR